MHAKQNETLEMVPHLGMFFWGGMVVKSDSYIEDWEGGWGQNKNHPK